MATRKSSSGTAGGILVFLGSLVYLYVVFTWAGLNGSGGTSAWLVGYAAFWAPIVAALAIVSAISLFFMGIGTLAGRMAGDKRMMDILWKFIMIAGITVLILTAGSAWFTWAVVGFILTYLGAMWAGM